MKILLYAAIILLSMSCKKTDIVANKSKKLNHEKIELDCIDKASYGATFQLRIDTQQEYDSLFYHMYTKPLDEWFYDNYNGLLEGVKKNYPNASPNQYDSIIVNDYVYNFLPFLGTKNCTHPELDLDIYTLLGQSITTSGCSTPNLESEVYINKEKGEVTFLTKIETYGSCEMGFSIYEWILVNKLPDDYTISYQLTENNVESN